VGLFPISGHMIFPSSRPGFPRSDVTETFAPGVVIMVQGIRQLGGQGVGGGFAVFLEALG
jgi:hypothetical protein